MHLYTMKKILVCTDFSAFSDQLLLAAEELRKKNGANIHLLHVSDLGLEINDVLTDPSVMTYKDAFLGTLKASLDEKMSAQLARCNSSAQPLIKSGNIEQVILELTRDGQFDLIVMGHRRSPLLSSVIGSTAYKIISSTPVPLLLVKAPLKLGHVAGLLDESREMDRSIIGTYDFFHNFKCSEVSFVSVWIDFPEPFGEQHSRHQMNDKLKEEVAHFSPVGVKAGIHLEPTREFKLAIPLERILREKKVDVAVMKKFSEGNLKRIYIGSTTKRLLESFNGNILILPP